mmetsp:Transcript_10671/g.21064  ORF Transcript_10671/g.21064 Transcript_10671/m.21064 type:complete len:291 (-) Transcript_10671:125-997(-)|eukprot:CAMPEP_0167818428 /NCGR_PEP_ID=MMETSP0112_2-20121227/4795_1 /TAXON_ID=91324 /ORGANISM="Lotharella globosa, Strain CCCM811" /LENGTH=290 /DNA_ID=CAMNT_0007718403 /DNA_START=36 /DNA_END=908 /DNA_ORIENTATION=-
MCSLANELEEVLGDIRARMHLKGLGSFRSMVLKLEKEDSKNSGTIDVEDFLTALNELGIFPTKRQVATMKRTYCGGAHELNTDMSYKNFVNGIQGDISSRRKAHIRRVYQVLDERKQMSLENLKKLAGPRNAAVFAGFSESPNFTEFSIICAGISAMMPLKDDTFCLTMEQLFGVPEHDEQNTNATEFIQLAKVEATLLDKIRQRTKSTMKEKEFLRKAFRYLDQDKSETISKKEMQGMLKKFGMNVEDRIIEALFAKFDTNKDGEIDYLEFVDHLYPGVSRVYEDAECA